MSGRVTFQSHILARITDELFGLTEGARAFFSWIVQAPPSVSTCKQAAHAFGINEQTFAGRFQRAGVAGPHATIAGVRLVKSAFLVHQRGSTIADVANTMGYSSPQAFARHVRQQTGMTPSAFFSEYNGPAALERFIASDIAPYRDAWRRFDPLATGSQWRRRARVTSSSGQTMAWWRCGGRRDGSPST